MSNIDKANSAPTATLNENELFENFMASNMEYTRRVGRRKVSTAASVRSFFECFETTGLNEVFERLSEECSDERWSNDPSYGLEFAAGELRGAAEHLDIVLTAFLEFKQKHLIDGEGERYSVPVTGEAEAA